MTTVNLQRKSNPGIRAGLAVIAGCVVAAGASVAEAATQSADVPSMVVRYADLDITTEQGAHTLYRRIVAAAQYVCPRADIRDLGRFAESRSCQAQATARAVQAVSSPRLAAVYAVHAKRG
jgi:UrcA family protein